MAAASLTSAQRNDRTLLCNRMKSLNGANTYVAFTLRGDFFRDNPNAVGLHHLAGTTLEEFDTLVRLKDEASGTIWPDTLCKRGIWKSFLKDIGFDEVPAKRIACKLSTICFHYEADVSYKAVCFDRNKEHQTKSSFELGTNE